MVHFLTQKNLNNLLNINHWNNITRTHTCEMPPKEHSCGAILFTYNDEGELGVVLGEEYGLWLPFKGRPHDGESFEDAARREINEETGGLVTINSIDLAHVFSSRYKEYHIGLVWVPYIIINEFNKQQPHETRKDFREKKRLQFFPFPSVQDDLRVHNLALSSIRFFAKQLYSYCGMAQPTVNEKCYTQAVSKKTAQDRCKSIAIDNSRSNKYGDFGKKKSKRQLGRNWRHRPPIEQEVPASTVH